MLSGPTDEVEVTCDVCSAKDSVSFDPTGRAASLTKKGWLVLTLNRFRLTPNADDGFDFSGLTDFHFCPNCADPDWLDGNKLKSLLLKAFDDALFCPRCGSYKFADQDVLCGTCVGEIQRGVKYGGSGGEWDEYGNKIK